MEKTENLGRKITDYLSKSLVSFKVLGDKIKNLNSYSKELGNSASGSRFSKKIGEDLSKIIKLENKEISKIESIEKEEKENLFGPEEISISMDKSFNKFDKKLGLSDFIKKLSKALDKNTENNSFGLFGGANNKLREASQENSGGDITVLGGIGRSNSNHGRGSKSSSAKGNSGIFNKGRGLINGAASAIRGGAVGGLLSKAGGALSGGAKFLGKSLTKKLPLGLGLAAGAIYAASRMADGDKMGAALETISGAAAAIPGAGTAISFGVDALIAARDNGVITDDKIKEELKKIPGIEYVHGIDNILSKKEIEEITKKNGGPTLEGTLEANLNKNPSDVNTEARKFTSPNQSNYTSATSDRATANYNSTTLSLQPAIRQKEKVVSVLKVDFEKEFGKDYVGGVGTIENDMNGNKFYYIHDELGNKNQVNKETYDKFVDHQQKLKKAEEDLSKAKSDIRKAHEAKILADKSAQLDVNIADALEREGEESFAEEYLDSKGITKDPDEVDKDLALILSEEGVDQEPQGEIRLDFSEDDEELRLDQNSDNISTELAKIEEENRKKRIERTAEEDMRRKMADGLAAETAINETRPSIVRDDYYLSTGQQIQEKENISVSPNALKKPNKIADIKALGSPNENIKTEHAKSNKDERSVEEIIENVSAYLGEQLPTKTFTDSEGNVYNSLKSDEATANYNSSTLNLLSARSEGNVYNSLKSDEATANYNSSTLNLLSARKKSEESDKKFKEAYDYITKNAPIVDKETYGGYSLTDNDGEKRALTSSQYQFLSAAMGDKIAHMSDKNIFNEKKNKAYDIKKATDLETVKNIKIGDSLTEEGYSDDAAEFLLSQINKNSGGFNIDPNENSINSTEIVVPDTKTNSAKISKENKAESFSLLKNRKSLMPSGISKGNPTIGSTLNANAMKIEKGNSTKQVVIANNSPTTVSNSNVTANNNPPSTKNTDQTANALNGFSL